jgi:hypothetical protein
MARELASDGYEKAKSVALRGCRAASEILVGSEAMLTQAKAEARATLVRTGHPLPTLTASSQDQVFMQRRSGRCRLLAAETLPTHLDPLGIA